VLDPDVPFLDDQPVRVEALERDADEALGTTADELRLSARWNRRDHHRHGWQPCEEAVGEQSQRLAHVLFQPGSQPSRYRARFDGPNRA
jgi:hypothetical protein